MKPALDYRRIGVYLAFAFGIAWTTALVIYLTGGLADSWALIQGTPVTVELVLVPTAYMFSPALSHALTRLVTREGWDGLYLDPRPREGWYRRGQDTSFGRQRTVRTFGFEQDCPARQHAPGKSCQRTWFSTSHLLSKWGKPVLR